MLGEEDKRALRVAGPGSVRIEENDVWCAYSGEWGVESGFFSGGYARKASVVGDSVTVSYSCPCQHDLFVGTSLYSDRGVVGIRLDGDQETDLDCRLDAEPAVVTRRKLRVRQQSARRGQITEYDQRGNLKVIRALVPLAETFGYATDLRSLTQGRASYSMEFDRYEEVPRGVAEKILGTRSKRAVRAGV